MSDVVFLCHNHPKPPRMFGLHAQGSSSRNKVVPSPLELPNIFSLAIADNRSGIVRDIHQITVL